MIPTGRREPMLFGLYAALAVAWIVIALGIAQHLSPFLESGLLAIGLSLGFALALGRWDDRRGDSRTAEDRAWDFSVNLALLVVGSAFLAVTVRTGAVHDYILHQEFWSVILRGDDPWYLEHGFWGLQPPNAYGPLFNLLAVPTHVHWMAPKLLFAASYIAAVATLTKSLAARGRASWPAVLGVMVWVWNPYAWIEVAIRGHFDVLVGAASVAAVHLRRRERDLPSASALATGVLLKYIPIVLLPFLALDRGRIRVRLVAATMVLIALGLGLSVLSWGPSTFSPLRFAATRSSTYLSIFRFLRGQYSPLRAMGIEPDLDRFGMPVLASALLGAWWWCRARRADPSTSAVLAMLVTLLLYRNGFPQYQIVLMMLATYWVVQTWERRRHRLALAIALAGYFGWIVAFDMVYYRIGDSSARFEDAVGLPTFLLGCVLAACLMWSEPVQGDGDY